MLRVWWNLYNLSSDIRFLFHGDPHPRNFMNHSKFRKHWLPFSLFVQNLHNSLLVFLVCLKKCSAILLLVSVLYCHIVNQYYAFQYLKAMLHFDVFFAWKWSVSYTACIYWISWQTYLRLIGNKVIFLLNGRDLHF